MASRGANRHRRSMAPRTPAPPDTDASNVSTRFPTALDRRTLARTGRGLAAFRRRAQRPARRNPDDRSDLFLPVRVRQSDPAEISIRRSNSPATGDGSGSSASHYERKRYFFILDHWKDEPRPSAAGPCRPARQAKSGSLSSGLFGQSLRRNRGKDASGRWSPGRRAESEHSSIWRPDRKRRGLRVLGRGLARSEAPDGRPG